MSNDNSYPNETPSMFKKESIFSNDNIKLLEYYTKKNSTDYEKKIIHDTLTNLLGITDEFLKKILFAMKSLDELYANGIINSKDKLAISFNGGKDCLAAYIVLKYYFYCKKFGFDYDFESFHSFCNLNPTSKENFSLKEYGLYLIYFINDAYFEEEENYVIEFMRREKIETFYSYSDIATGLKYLIKNYDLKFVFMGTRVDDMGIKQVDNSNRINENKLIHPSTHPYPTFLRFYPIYNFNFEEVWKIILVSKFKYLELYDKGYSSIGKKHNTHVNKNLIVENSVLPAWCLKKFDTEREYRK
jgi:3'-phosphoadenosine 5'-phosphosulfate sulfotransferase (PAPS reductase)/FAD synthetase